MKKTLLILSVSLLALGAFPAPAPAQHSHGGSTGSPLEMFSKEVSVNDMRVVFQIMENKTHKKMLDEMKKKEEPEKGTTHNIAVQLLDEKTRKETLEAKVNMKVIGPDGKDQIKPLKADEMMKYYSGYFDLSRKGKYQVLILFKVGERTSSAGIEYELK
jgi:hypothetical protein